MVIKKTISILFLILITLILLVGCSGGDSTQGIKYTLNIEVKPENGGSVTPVNGGEYEQGTVVTLTPTPAAGYKFDHWDGADGNDVAYDDGESEYKIIMDNDKSIVAVFIEQGAPEIEPIADKTVVEGEELSFEVIASDPDGNDGDLVYSASGDLTEYFDPATHLFSWTPGFDDQGTYNITFSVSDGEFISNVQVTITVKDKQPVAQEWVKVGDEIIEGVDSLCLFVDDGTPYIGYRDLVENSSATVIKYNNDNWETVGEAGFFYIDSLNKRDFDLFVDQGTPYFIGVRELLSDEYIRLYKYSSGFSWGQIGESVAVNDSFMNSPSLYINNSTPYISYLAKGGRVYTSKFNSTTGWSNLGNEINGYRYYWIDTDCWQNIKITFNNDTPYLAYIKTDWHDDRKANVKRYDENDNIWVTIGEENFPVDHGVEVDYIVDFCFYNGIPYLGCITNEKYLSVFKYDNNQWQLIGESLNSGKSYIMHNKRSSFFLYDNQPCFAFIQNDKPVVKKYNGAFWDDVGVQESLSNQVVDCQYLDAFLSDDDILYLAFCDDSDNYNELTVMKYNLHN